MSEIKVDENGTPYLEIPWTLRRNGFRVQLIVPEMDTDAFRNDPLAQAIIKGHQYARLMESGKYDTVLQLSQALHLDRSAVAKKLALANLCPEVIEAVFSGTAPESLNLSKVTKGFPDDWGEQKRLCGLE